MSLNQEQWLDAQIARIKAEQGGIERPRKFSIVPPTIKPTEIPLPKKGTPGTRSRRITPEEHNLMKQRRKEGWSHDEIAAELQTSSNTVFLHLGLSMGDPIMQTAGRGEKHGMAKMTEEGVIAMRYLYATGDSVEYLAKRFGLSESGTHHIVTRVSWRHIP